jgi:hypothetical protein
MALKTPQACGMTAAIIKFKFDQILTILLLIIWHGIESMYLSDYCPSFPTTLTSISYLVTYIYLKPDLIM